MRIASFNVNSIRARMPRFLEWLAEADPDIVAIQETKVEDDLFPLADLPLDKYQIHISGQKRYNGVAIMSKHPVEDITTGFGMADWPEDCRIITGMIEGVRVINTYVPNGTSVGGEKWGYKMGWLENFRSYLDHNFSPREKVIWLGDINIAPGPNDVYESQRHLGSVGHHPDEFIRLAKIKEWGWTDCFRKFSDEPGYTFWEFRAPRMYERDYGWRIDHIYASDAMEQSCTRCWVDRDVRGKIKPSDHAPLLAEFDW